MWATTDTGEEIRWNHLKGDAVIINYRAAAAWEYTTFAYATGTNNVANGAQTDGTAGQLKMDGEEYVKNFTALLFDFYATAGNPFDTAALDTDLTLLVLGADLRQDDEQQLPPAPVCTKPTFKIWNEEETDFYYDQRCICCWDQALLSNYDVVGLSIFMRDFLQTNKGYARVQGVSSGLCPDSVDAPLLGVAAKHMSFGARGADGTAYAGMNLPGYNNSTDSDDASTLAVIHADFVGEGGTGERPSGAVLGGAATRSFTR
ncbi:MAG: hypothetical protein GY842_21580 [bacterium]|nr:hypothetical protein [bacterium]